MSSSQQSSCQVAEQTVSLGVCPGIAVISSFTAPLVMMLSCTAALLSLWIWRSCWAFACEPPPLFQTQLDLRLLYLRAWSMQLNPRWCLTGSLRWPDLSTGGCTLHETSWPVETDEGADYVSCIGRNMSPEIATAGADESVPQLFRWQQQQHRRFGGAITLINLTNWCSNTGLSLTGFFSAGVAK